MLVLSWNVNSIRARLPQLLALVSKHEPDVVCVQETRVPEGSFPQDELARAGYHSVHNPGGGRAGVALLSRVEPSGVTCDPLEGVASEGRWIEATIGDTRFISAYVHNGRMVGHPQFGAKLRFLDAVVTRARVLRTRGPAVMAGDFNVAPEDIDVHSSGPFVGATHVSVQERRRIRAVFDEGYVDAYRNLHPNRPGFTWWDYRFGSFQKDTGMRIDLALVSEDLVGLVDAVDVLRAARAVERPSDHAPLLLRIADATPAEPST